ncbi:hypothetical protein R1sor_010020 [Riccia sorocarpa]|uniref:UVR domain-containing protein n=1 Tax=Riccia sorocarpa TaxID=122646 RepID=A0ABD3I2V7_9MARC
MADAAGNDMDSLFEGMDFVLPDELEEVSEPPADESHVDSIPPDAKELHGSMAVPALAAPVLPSVLPASSSSSANSLSSLPSLSRNTSGSLAAAGQLSPSAPGGLQRDPNKPLDESLFSGLSVSFLDDEVSSQQNHESIEINTASSEDGVQLRRAGSSDAKQGTEKAVNAEKERPTVEAIMTAYTTSGLKHSSSGIPPASKATPSLTSSPSQKSGIRRKKRSVKIGYGREEEEQEELALLRKTAAQLKTPGSVAAKEIGNGIYDSSPRLSVSSYDFSRTSSQGQLDVEEISDSTSAAGETEISTQGTSEAEAAKTEVPPASTSLEAQSSSSEIVSESTTIKSASETSDPQKVKELQQAAETHEEQQNISTRVAEPEFLSSGVREKELSVSVTSSHVPEEEVAVEKADEEDQPDELLKETHTEDLDTTSSTVEATVAEGEVSQEERASEAEISAADLDLTSLAANKGGSIEERLIYIQGLVARAMDELQRRNSAVSSLRKAAVQQRRQAAEKVSAVSTRYKDLEAELNAACENEDFEKADSLSESFAEAENAMQQATEEFKSAEANCDLASFKVQEILDLQVALEEDAARLFTSLKQEAEHAGERARTEAQESARQEMERLSADEEAAEAKRRKLVLSRRVVEEANADLDKTIGEATNTETELKSSLTEQRSRLQSDLEDLLELVRKKEAEIADCDQQIAAVDGKMRAVLGNFETQRSSLEAEAKALEASSAELEEVFKRIAQEKQGVSELLAAGVKEGLRLEEVARSAADAEAAVQVALKLKTSIANTASFYKQKKAELAEKEKTAHEQAQALRKDSLSGRSSLQELTTSKMKLNQEIAEKKQRMLFMDKRIPELDSEKKLAAAARNFKEAGRLAAEAKALNLEKEAATSDITRMSSELQHVESEAEQLLGLLADTDSLIADKERKAAIARCERLRLMAAAARMERDAAIELEDFEEAESLDSEAEAADSEAEDLQRVYQLVGEVFEKQVNSLLDSSPARSAEETQNQPEKPGGTNFEEKKPDSPS